MKKTTQMKLGALIRVIRAYQGAPTALGLAPMLFQRPGELFGMAWAELDLDAALWTIPASRMKTGAPHLVPLPVQAVALLRQLQPLTGGAELVFPHESPISDNMRLTVHGFRATAHTLLAEELDFDPLLIEAQLAQAVKDANGQSYSGTTYLQQCAAMMQRWADYLDTLACTTTNAGEV